MAKIEWIKVEDSEGLILAHDLTGIVPFKSKGAILRKGHRIKKEDIPLLLKIGKEKVMILSLDEDEIHEDNAASFIAEKSTGENIELKKPGEAWIEGYSKIDGLFKVKVKLLKQGLTIEEIVIATIPSNTPVKKGIRLTKIKIVPLFIKEERLERFEDLILGGPIMDVIPYKIKTAGVITVGNEIVSGRVKDAFGPLIREKLEDYGVCMCEQLIVKDEVGEIEDAILEEISLGRELIIVTGGMSPDDFTVRAISDIGKVAVRGVPMSPAAMLTIAYRNDVPVVGIPAGALTNRITSFDVFLPRILTGEKITREKVVELANGGLCMNCESCNFPFCSFGKGGEL